MYSTVDISEQTLNNDIFNLLKNLTEQYGELFLFESVDEFIEQYLLDHDSPERVLRGIICEDSFILGFYYFITSGAGTSDERVLLRLHMKKNIFSLELSRMILSKAREYLIDVDHFYLITYTDKQKMLAKNLHGKLYNQTEHYILMKNDIDRDFIRETSDTIAKKNPDLELRFCKMIADDYIHDYCALFRELMQDNPGDIHEDISIEDIKLYNEKAKQSGGLIYSYLLFDINDNIIGMTNVWITSRSNPVRLYQFMTGIKRDYRGRDLALYMKAVMLIRLLKDFSDFSYIEADNHPDNLHIIDINRRLGYKLKSKYDEYIIMV